MKTQALTRLLLTMALLPGAGIASGQQPEDAAQAGAKAWLALVDQAEYAQSWEEAAAFFKGAISKEDWVKMVAGVRNPLGKRISRKVRSRHYAEELPGAPDGKYVVIQFEATFENKKRAIETVTPVLDDDGVWRVSGYYIN